LLAATEVCEPAEAVGGGERRRGRVVVRMLSTRGVAEPLEGCVVGLSIFDLAWNAAQH